MNEEKNYWRSRIEIVIKDNLQELEVAVNEFCKDKFVVGIQYPDAFQGEEYKTAIISYKVQEEPGQKAD